MTKLQQNIRDFMIKAEQVVRNNPSQLTREEAKLRVKLVFEEAFELAAALGIHLVVNNIPPFRMNRPQNSIIAEDISLVGDLNINTDLIEAADAIADLNYVVNGTACAIGIDMEPIDDAVHESNMSKFIDGYRREDGKWVKGPSYKPVDIKPLIEAQL